MLLQKHSMKMVAIFMTICINAGSSMAQAKVKTVITQQLIPNKMFSAEIRELKIGDSVPDFEFEVFNYPTSKAKFSDFSGKFIILDFWATWCGPCLNKFPELESIQNQFKGRNLQVLLVNSKETGDSRDKISEFFFKRKAHSSAAQLASIVNDTISDKLFPHRVIPHYVLIDQRGIVRAITSSDQINSSNIQAFLDGQNLYLETKEELSLDPQKPLFVNGNGGNTDAFVFRSLLTHYNRGLSSTSGVERDESTQLVTRIYYVNVPVLLLYKEAYPEIYQYSLNRLKFRVSSLSNFYGSDDWYKKKLTSTVSYELIVPRTTMEQVRNYMKEDLKRYFGLKVYVENQNVDCAIIKQRKRSRYQLSRESDLGANRVKNDSSFTYNAKTNVDLVNYLGRHLGVPIIDETKTKLIQNIKLPSKPDNTKQLKNILKDHGLLLEEGNRKVEFMIISK